MLRGAIAIVGILGLGALAPRPTSSRQEAGGAIVFRRTVPKFELFTRENALKNVDFVKAAEGILGRTHYFPATASRWYDGILHLDRCELDRAGLEALLQDLFAQAGFAILENEGSVEGPLLVARVGEGVSFERLRSRARSISPPLLELVAGESARMYKTEIPTKRAWDSKALTTLEVALSGGVLTRSDASIGSIPLVGYGASLFRAAKIIAAVDRFEEELKANDPIEALQARAWALDERVRTLELR